MTLSNRVGLILALSFTVSCSIVSMKRKQTDDSQELDRDNKTVLIRAAEEGDIEQVQELIEDTNTKINAQDIYKRTALMHAIIHGHYEIVQVLLEHNADKEHLDYFGLTPLLLAIQNQQKEIVDLLLKHRADITSPMTTHLPIETAAAFNYLEIVKVLLAHGALVNPINFYQTPALTSAASHGHREMAAFLLNQGAFINTVDRENKSALSHAIEKGL